MGCNYFRQATHLVLASMTLFCLTGTIPSYGQGSYQGHADGSLHIETLASGNFSYNALQGETSQSSLYVGNANASTDADTTAAGALTTCFTDVSGNSASPSGTATSSSTTTDTGFDLFNNTGKPLIVVFDWTGAISGNITANLSNSLSKVSSSFELAFLPSGKQMVTLATIEDSLSNQAGTSFAQSSSGQSEVTIPEGTSTLYCNLDPEGESSTGPNGEFLMTPEPASILLICTGSIGPLCFAAFQRRKQRE